MASIETKSDEIERELKKKFIRLHLPGGKKCIKYPAGYFKIKFL